MDLKRIFDVASASIALIISIPILGVAAAAILFEDGFPILFRQRRIGQFGQTFFILKLRKFRNAAAVHTSKISLTDDDRYSRVGKVLDKLKINELPQLINVLRGDMSLVGPRPEIPEFSECFSGPYTPLLKVKPGLFGPSQTLFRNEADLYPRNEDPSNFYAEVIFPYKAAVDLKYYQSNSIISDLGWIFKSLTAVAGGIRRSSPTSEELRQRLRRRARR